MKTAGGLIKNVGDISARDHILGANAVVMERAATEVWWSVVIDRISERGKSHRQ